MWVENLFENQIIPKTNLDAQSLWNDTQIQLCL
jgi:hypothetical protein